MKTDTKKIALIVGIILLIIVSGVFAAGKLLDLGPDSKKSDNISKAESSTDMEVVESESSKVTPAEDSTATTDTEATAPAIKNAPVFVTNSDPKEDQKVYRGYFIDQDCFIAYANPWEDNRDCLQMDSCAASGYGIAVLQGDASYQFYFFDGAFAPSPTGGQSQAKKFINGPTKEDHVFIEVQGVLTNEKKTAANGQSYSLLKISTLKESTAPTED